MVTTLLLSVLLAVRFSVRVRLVRLAVLERQIDPAHFDPALSREIDLLVNRLGGV